ncbi:hypothetical protein TSAR_001122 [Trichomalopsis sarcophagae]|uniref:THAP-type domain-containing protein n=1 Tax=Trichomalopsis sarcophagae TaxID=543379 RepID=A0A232ESS3_9HYME|nr:hypothetical protein TSAR_001122 [Trichomalopsis sarcophagae]
MPKKCCLPNCKVQRDDPEGLDLSFYIIPADENLRKKWSENIKQHYNVEFKKYNVRNIKPCLYLPYYQLPQP